MDIPVQPWREFPIEEFPEPLQSYVGIGAESIGCNSAFVAQPMLAAVAGVIGTSAQIQLKPTWLEPSVLWGATVGQSGAGKSPGFQIAIAPLQTVEAKSRANGEANLCLLRDATYEAICSVHKMNKAGFLLGPDELDDFFASITRHGRGSDSPARFLSLFNGGEIKKHRSSTDEKEIHVPRTAVSISGTIQPKILWEVLGEKQIASGFAARFLFTMPPDDPPKWSNTEVDQSVVTRIDRLFDSLFQLRKRADTILIPVSPEAKAAFIARSDEVQDNLVFKPDDVRAVLAKWKTTAARIALILQCVSTDVEELPTSAVSEATMASAIKITDWFAHEAERLYAMRSLGASTREILEVSDFAKAMGGAVTSRELMRKFRRYDTVVKADEILKAGCKLGVFEREEILSGPKGGRPSSRYVLEDTQASSK